MTLTKLLAELTGLQCSMAVLDAWWKYARVRLPDGRDAWAMAEPGDPETVVQPYRVVIRPSNAVPVVLQHTPTHHFVSLLLQSRSSVRAVDPGCLLPDVDRALAAFYQ